MSVSGFTRLKTSMFAPEQVRCGIRDYAAYLVAALQQLPDIEEIAVVAAPAHGTRSGLTDVLSHYLEDARTLRTLGHAMGKPADLAHVQHQYFFFGGVAPHKTHVRAFLDALPVPAVMTVHEIAQSAGGPLQRWVVRIANLMNFRHPAVRALLVHTAADREQLTQLGIPAEKVYLIRHAVPPALPGPDPEVARHAFHAEYPQLEGKRILTLFGFLSAKKGHSVALDALALLPADTAVLFAGDRHPDDQTDYVPVLCAEIERRGLGNRVVVTGYLPAERIPQIMAVTDVAIAPFLRSSGSGSLANLIAYGCAIVASDIAPHRELADYHPGLLSLFPTGDAQGLANAIRLVLGDAALRKRLQVSALGYAARHSYLQMARETVQVYLKVLGRQAP